MRLGPIVFVTALIVPAAASEAAVLTLTVAGESTELKITHCRTDPHSYGQLAIETEILAVGSFRGEPAALLLTKVAGAETDTADLYLVELAAELRTMRPLEVSGKILNDHAALHSRRLAELNAEYSRQALAELPPEKMMAEIEEQSARVEALDEEMEALAPPMARSFGAATVDGSTVRFAGSDTRIIDGQDERAFAGVEGEMSVIARCGD